MPKQLLNNSKTTFRKSRKRVFWPRNVSNDSIWEPKFALSFVIRGHIPTFWAKSKARSRPLKIKNNTQTTFEQIQSNFQKVQKTTFLAPIMFGSWVAILANVSIFGCILDLKAEILPQKRSHQFLNHSPFMPHTLQPYKLEKNRPNMVQNAKR